MGLCSLIVSLCFAITFELIARHQRSARHWRLWSLGNLAFCLGVVGFDLSPHPVAAIPAFTFYTLLAVGPLAICAGLDAFQQERSPTLRGSALALLPGVAFIVAPIMTFGTTSLPQFLAGAGLAVGLAAAGGYLLLAATDRLVTARRLLGIAMLANLPSYASALVLPLQPTGPFYAVAHYAWLSQPVLMLITNLALLAIPGLQAIDDLRTAALTDALTGLHNRAWLANAAASHARRGGMIGALDLDGFKQVNDRHGHAVGDELLIAFATCLRSWCIRHGADAVRLGGDEFLILIPTASEHLAGDLRRHVGVHGLPVAALPRWSASIGFAPIPAHSASLTDAMRAADLALYRDKNSRRDSAYAQAA